MPKTMLVCILFCILCVMTACISVESIKGEKWDDNSSNFTTEYGEMFGEEGSIGIIGSKTVTETGQKWMWHFWGTEDISYKDWEVKAFKQGEKKKLLIQ